MFSKDRQYYKFCFYGFLKNLRFFDAFFLLFLLEKGLSYSEIGILYAIREIVINLSEIPSGIVADTYGRKNALLFSFVLYITSFIIYFFATSFWFFLVAFVFYGLADAFRSGTHKGMLMDYLKINGWQDSKIDYYGHTRACSQRGSALASLMAGLLVFYYGSYRIIFIFSIIPYFINLLLVASYPASLNTKNTKVTNKKIFFVKNFKNLLITIKQPEVIRIVNLSAIFTGFQKAVKDYIQPLLLQVAILIPFFSEYGNEKKNGLWVGILFFIIYLLNAEASKTAHFFSKNNNRYIIYSSLFVGFIFSLISGVLYSNKFWICSLLFFIGIYIVENIRKPILTGFLADSIENNLLTSVLSVQSLWRTIITSAIALLLGFLSDSFGVGIAMIIVSLLLIIFVFLLKNIAKE